MVEESEYPSDTNNVDALYLFACAVLWRRQCDLKAGWELVRALVSNDPAATTIAAAVLGTQRGSASLLRTLAEVGRLKPRAPLYFDSEDFEDSEGKDLVRHN